MYVYIYIYVCIYIYVYIYVCIHTDTYIYICTGAAAATAERPARPLRDRAARRAGRAAAPDGAAVALLQGGEPHPGDDGGDGPAACSC